MDHFVPNGGTIWEIKRFQSINSSDSTDFHDVINKKWWKNWNGRNGGGDLEWKIGDKNKTRSIGNNKVEYNL